MRIAFAGTMLAAMAGTLLLLGASTIVQCLGHT